MKWLLSIILSILVALIAGEVFLRFTWEPPLQTEDTSEREGQNGNGGFERVLYPFAGWRLSSEHPKVNDWGLGVGNPSKSARISVAVTGGSVAFGLVRSNILLQALSNHIGVDPTDIRILNFAVPAYKQPQQVHTVVEQLIAGANFDYLINLDGFNEAVLASQNIAVGAPVVWPSAPMWFAEVGVRRAKDPEVVRRAARLLDLKDELEKLENQIACEETPCLRFHQLASSIRAGSVRRALAETEILLHESSTAIEWDIPIPPSSCATDCSIEIVQVWSESSRLMAAILESKSVRYIHVLQPNPHVGQKALTKKEAEMASAMNRTGWPEYAARITPLQRTQLSELAKEGVLTIDATGVFENTLSQRYADGCCHLTATGKRDLANAIVSAIDWDVPIHQ